MEIKDEIVEEINEEEIETVSEETITFEPIKDEKPETETSENDALVSNDYKSNKGKTALIIFLVILLVLDVAALIIYIIGIDKILDFIK